VRCTPDEVIVTPGARATSALIARIFTRPGSLSVVEDPGDPYMIQALRIAGGDVVSIPIDRDGIRVDRLPSEACIVHVTPSWQFPMGGTMPMKRREQLLAWAHRTGALIIEDDREGELRYEGPSLPSLQGMDRDGRVVYVGASRRFCLPGLDLSYAVVPPGYVDRFLGMIHVDGQSPGELSQRAFARFIDEGHFERFLRRLRLVLATRQTVLTETIDRELGWLLRADAAPAGSHLVASVIDPAWTATRVAEVATASGLSMTSTRLLHAERNGPDREVLMPYGAHGADEIRVGLRRLARAARDARGGPGSGPVPAVGPGSSNRPNGHARATAIDRAAGSDARERSDLERDAGRVPRQGAAPRSPFELLPEPRLYRVGSSPTERLGR
jgi:GntR family transcriptional regulator/MocR family aminotransferase